MHTKHRSLLLAGLALLSITAMADTSGMYPNVTEVRMTYASYHTLATNLGPSEDFPKLVVYSPNGECVGVSGSNNPTADQAATFITDSLRKNHKACDTVLSSKFGVGKLGKDSGTGKPEAVLYVIDNFPYCKACNAFRQTLLRESHTSLANVRLTITAVTLDKKS